jgi:two-component system, cell cycle sensor histidine kinase and response regulator CckA
MESAARRASPERADGARVLSFSRGAGLFVTAVGGLVLVGWAFGLTPLIQVVPGAIAMAPNTALSFLLSGMALWLSASPKSASWSRTSHAAAAAAGLLGLLTLVEYALGRDLGIDELLFRDPTGLTATFPGRMAAATGLSFVAFASSLLLSDRRPPAWVADTLAVVPGALGLVSLVGHASGVRGLYWMATYKGMAIHTAFAFLALSAGTLLARGDRGFSGLVTSPTAAGVMVRRILPAAVGVPLLFGWLRLAGDRAGLYGTEFGVALVAVANAVVITTVLCAVAAALMGEERERKEAEEALAESELYFRSLIEHSLDITAVLAPDGALHYVSPSVRRVLGYAPSDLEGRNVFELLHPEDRVLGEEAFRRALETGSRFEEFEFRIGHHDGSWRTLSAIAKRLPPETGLDGLIVNGRDLTESRRLEAQLREALKMEAVGRLAGGVAHDFNNLLTVVSGHADLLLQTLPADDTARESVEEIAKAASRAANLTRQLLAFSRKQVMTPRVLDLNAVLTDLESILRRTLGEDIELVISKAPALGSVKADPGQIEQVLVNLAVNARHAMPEGGRLTIETANVEMDDAYVSSHAATLPGLYVMLAVSDTGVGMDAETRSHIFEPFFTTKGPGKGTGLGLATSYGIVKQSHGTIWAYSEPGKGATFKIYLPRVDEAARAPVVRAGGDLLPRGTETILVVEDEDGVRRLVRGALEAQGYTVLEAASGPAALEAAGRHADPIHLILTDLVMPGIHGRALADQLLVTRPGARVLFMSGYTGDAVWHNGLVEPGTSFLQKPFTSGALARKVREVLDAR